MSIFLSYLIIPLVVLLLILNIIFRIKIIRKYNKIKNEKMDFEVGSILNKSERKRIIEKLPAEQAEKLIDFSNSLRNLIYIAVTGFVLIFLIFLFIYLKS